MDSVLVAPGAQEIRTRLGDPVRKADQVEAPEAEVVAAADEAVEDSPAVEAVVSVDPVGDSAGPVAVEEAVAEVAGGAAAAGDRTRPLSGIVRAADKTKSDCNSSTRSGTRRRMRLRSR